MKIAYLLFIALLAVASLWVSFDALTKFYRYTLLQAKTTPFEISWRVEKVGGDEFVLSASYHYTVKEQLYQGEAAITKPLYRNPWSAEDALKRVQKAPLPTIYYDPDQPQKSHLERVLPIKEIVYSAIVWLIVAYFWMLKKKKEKEFN